MLRAIFDAMTCITEIVEIPDTSDPIPSSTPPVATIPTDADRISALEEALLTILMGG